LNDSDPGEHTVNQALAIIGLIGAVALIIVSILLYRRKAASLGVVARPRQVLGCSSVPRHIYHRFWNSSTQTTVFTIENRPAQHLEQALRAAFGLARDGKVNKVGIPTNIWELALIFQLAESFLPGASLFLQKGLFGVLAAIARQRGYDPAFSQYTQAKDVK
jgi:hypothetical protein